jgi:hypothetical protein
MRHSEKHQAFINSAYFKEARLRGLRNAWAKQANGPKCGAKRRSDGQPCRQPVTAEGKRCRYHGGATPKGKEWHRKQWPQKGAAPSRLKTKMVSLSIREKEAKLKREAMSPNARKLHEARRKAMQPGTPAERQGGRDDREAQKLLEDLQNDEKPLSGGQKALFAQIRQLEEKAMALQAESAQNEEQPDVFS